MTRGAWRVNTRLQLVAGLLIVACGVALGSAAQAQAQPAARPVALTPAQLELINQGAEASNEGDYLRAVRLLRTALEFGEVNVAWLNLGRALQKAGQCDQAEEAFERARAAPPVKGLPPATVASKVDEYSAELSVSCPGLLRVSCAPAQITVSIADASGVEQAGRCGDQQLAPGRYTIVGSWEQQRSEQAVELSARGLVSVELRFEVAEPLPPPPEPGLPLGFGVRYLPSLGIATGRLLKEDGSTSLDQLPADGFQDSLSDYQPSRLNHTLALDLGYVGERFWLGGLLQLQLAALALDAGVQGRFNVARRGALQLDLTLQGTYGTVQQVLSDDDLRFIAEMGPFNIGGGGVMIWWMTPELGLTAGLLMRLGLPDIGAQGALTLGVEWRPWASKGTP